MLPKPPAMVKVDDKTYPSFLVGMFLCNILLGYSLYFFSGG
jgi:hypothetical protein